MSSHNKKHYRHKNTQMTDNMNLAEKTENSSADIMRQRSQTDVGIDRSEQVSSVTDTVEVQKEKTPNVESTGALSEESSVADIKEKSIILMETEKNKDSIIIETTVPTDISEIKTDEAMVKSGKRRKPVEEPVTPDNICITSLRKLKQTDIKDSVQVKKSNDVFYNIFRYLILTVCAGVFIYSGYSIALRLVSYVQASAAYDDIRDLYRETAENQINTPVKMLQTPLSFEVLSEEGGNFEVTEYESVIVESELDKKINNLERLQKLNKDTMGWLYVGLTNIDYPIMQGPYNDYYLSRNFNKVIQTSGSIFIDSRNSKKVEENKHIIVYGHNMYDNTMFRQVLLFRDKEEVFRKSYIEITTKEGIYIYKPYAVYRSDPYVNYIETDFADDEEWLFFIQETQKKSMYKTNIVLKPEDMVCTLSTCTNTADDNRLVVHCVLSEIIYRDGTKMTIER